MSYAYTTRFMVRLASLTLPRKTQREKEGLLSVHVIVLCRAAKAVLLQLSTQPAVDLESLEMANYLPNMLAHRLPQPNRASAEGSHSCKRVLHAHEPLHTLSFTVQRCVFS